MQDLTTGSITRHLLKTASFMLVTMIFQTLYFLIDLYWVGRLGKEAVAAVAIAGNLTFIVLAVSQMLGVGTTTLVSHATGRKDHEQALLVFNQSQVLSLLVGLIFFAVAMALRGAYASGVGADGQTAAMARDYLTWFIPAMALQFAMVAMGSALRGTGNFKPGMVVSTATVVLNMLLAPFLIFGWVTGRAFGVAGAAVSSLVAVVVGTIWLALYFVKPSAYLHYLPRLWMPRTELWGRMLKIGLPAGAEFALMAVYLFIVYVITRPFGAAAQAGFGIGLRVVQAGFMPVVALGFSVAPVAGQNFGARLPQRVKQTFYIGVGLAAATMVLWAIVCYFNAAAMVRLFSGDPQVIAVGDEYLRIIAWSFIGSGIVFVSSSMFQAIGNTLPPLAASFARIVLVGVPAVVMSRMAGFELRWIWYLSAASVIFQVVAVLWLLRREFRLRLISSGLAEPTPATARTG
ncbi:MAG TPA: MATE family efflux transporter [Vicinamibacterales bacterium]|nr:MATE family efflux transporter [Vicinamibacterales bacterium]